VAETRAPGLRLQIVLALGALMLLAFLPLSFAVARLTEATLDVERERAAIAVARAAAAGVASSPRDEGGARDRAIAAQIDARNGVEAIAIVPDAAGDRPVARRVLPHVFEVTVPIDGGAVRARIRDGEARGSAPLARLIALYIALFGIALLMFAYFALTRLIVRPIDALVRSTRRVADGARSIDVPRGGSRELAELGESVRAMAARLLREEETLRAKVGELTEATHRLTDAQARLVRSERMASVGRLAAGVAHEIGNPIAAISGMEDLLLDGGLSPEEERDFLVRMKRETERIHGILRDLLDFARPEQRDADPAREGRRSAPPDVRGLAPLPVAPSGADASAEANVSDVVRDVVALVRPQKDFKPVAIRVAVPEDLGVALDGGKLTQVLLNLLLNAASAMRPHGGEIAVTAEVAGDDVHLAVEDTGPGLSPEIAGDVFEPFVTTKPVGEGSGLGLAVCRGIVEAASGTIAFDRGRARGARAVITLPRSAGAGRA